MGLEMRIVMSKRAVRLKSFSTCVRGQPCSCQLPNKLKLQQSFVFNWTPNLI